MVDAKDKRAASAIAQHTSVKTRDRGARAIYRRPCIQLKTEVLRTMARRSEKLLRSVLAYNEETEGLGLY